MLCQNCQKKTATIHLTEVDHQNVKNEIHLCEECAGKKGIAPKLQFSLTELLSGLIEPVMGSLMKEELVSDLHQVRNDLSGVQE